ncbi:MAG TPA: FixH family protein [Pyrinomonadaceae bacterium]|nr:FixH family protein [Pyrinomonadaceae bacterium]
MKKFVVTIVIAIALGVVLVIVAACGSKTGADQSVPTGKVIKTVPVGNLTATLSNSTGQLKQGDQEVTLAFNDASGKPVDAGAVSLAFHMPAMGGMAAMNDAVTFTTTNMPGIYRGKVNIEVGGEWQAQLAYEGPAGKGKTTFSVPAR